MTEGVKKQLVQISPTIVKPFVELIDDGGIELRAQATKKKT